MNVTYDRFEVRNLKYAPKKSIVGDCFSLELWVDGEKFAEVSNSGDEKQSTVRFVAPLTCDDGQRIASEMAQDSFLVPDSIDASPFYTGVRSLMRLAIAMNDIQTGSKEKAVYVFDGKLMRLGYNNPGMLPDQRLFDHVTSTYPGAVILNAMDPIQAAKLSIQMERDANPDMSGPYVFLSR